MLSSGPFIKCSYWHRVGRNLEVTVGALKAGSHAPLPVLSVHVPNALQRQWSCATKSASDKQQDTAVQNVMRRPPQCQAHRPLEGCFLC